MEKSEIKGFIAKRVAKELKDGDVVNLGIGLPTLVPNYLPEGIHVTLQAENGTIGSASAGANPDPIHDVDAGGSPSGIVPGGSFIDSSVSFGLIRGGMWTPPFWAAWKWTRRAPCPTGSSPARRCPAWAAPWTCW